MNNIFGVIGLFVTCWIYSGSVSASTLTVENEPKTALAQASESYPIAPSQAAMIARDSIPGSKVLSVKLLPSGVYAVTLKTGSNVTKILVDAKSGAIS